MLRDKRAVITGSTSGIGLSYAKALAAEGVHVCINGFGDAAAIEAERASLEAKGVKAIYSDADMTPVSSMSRRWMNFRTRNGTRSLPLTCRPPFTR